MLITPDGRKITYLRISVTSRCQLSCAYCSAPTEPMRPELSPDAIEQVATCALPLGITHFRLTGGESLTRDDLFEIVRRLAGFSNVDLSLTTNGLRLQELAAELHQAGLSRLNVSLPSVNPLTFKCITGAARLPEVLAGIGEARRVGFSPIKTNTVVLKSINDGEVDDIVAFARERGLVPRFIEYMPTRGARQPWLVKAADIVDKLSAAEDPAGARGNGGGPATYYTLPDGFQVGIIAPITRPFCGSCNRLRLTSDGCLRPCLTRGWGVDLLPVLAQSNSEEPLAHAFHQAAHMKPARHRGMLEVAMRGVGG